MKPTSDTAALQTLRPLKQQLREFIPHLRAGVGNLTEPKAQALLETSAEVLTGLLKAFEDYEEGRERAWRSTPASKVTSQKKTATVKR